MRHKTRARKPYIAKSVCCGCGACVDACPAGAVQMRMDREGFYYPHIERKLCIGCNQCGQSCPIKAIDTGTCMGSHGHDYYAAQAKDDMARSSSTSGGVFHVLSEYVLSHQGVVFGVAFDNDMRAVHQAAHDQEELQALKGTKYVQSDMCGTYIKAQRMLENGALVLFSGTPCQVHGLKLFLGRDYRNLILVDLICYGVPSPGVWRSYVRHLEHKYGGRMTGFSFRDKRNRDDGHTCACRIGGIERSGPLYDDVYADMYFKNETIRPSCHACRYCTFERASDITLGDFWGIENVRPDMADGMGTSAVIIHTQKGRDAWLEINGHLRWHPCENDDMLQPRLVTPTPPAPGRRWFMAFYNILPFSVFQHLFLLFCKSKR